jgi:hypothetical protein
MGSVMLPGCSLDTFNLEMLAINGNVEFPLSFLFILLLKFLTLPLIVSGCLSGSNLIGLDMEKVEFNMPFKI